MVNKKINKFQKPRAIISFVFGYQLFSPILYHNHLGWWNIQNLLIQYPILGISNTPLFQIILFFKTLMEEHVWIKLLLFVTIF